MLHLKSFKINAQTLRNGTAKQSTKQNSIYAPNSFFRYAPCFSLQSVHFLFFPLLDAIKYESFDVKLKFVQSINWSTYVLQIIHFAWP